MLDATHPGSYSVYWNLPNIRKPSYINTLTISLGLFAATLTGTGMAVAGQFSHLPSPEEIAVIPPGAEGMNIYPVTGTTDVWPAPHSETTN